MSPLMRSIRVLLGGGTGRRVADRPKLLLEPLEPRLLLSADPLLAYVANESADLLLRIDESEDRAVIELIDQSVASPTVIARQLLSDGPRDEIRIIGSSLDDSLTLDASLFEIHSLVVSFDGGAGDDRLVGPTSDTTWTITGANAGQVGPVAFANVENLLGAADNQDTFVLTGEEGLSGVVDGGEGGFDSLVIAATGHDRAVFTATDASSGWIDLDDQRLSYAGLEPIVHNDIVGELVFDLTAGSDPDARLENDEDPTQLKLTGSTFENITFKRPTASLTVRGGLGDDTISIGPLDLGNAALSIEAETILVTGPIINAKTVTLSASGTKAVVSVEGSMTATGAVTVSAQASRTLSLSTFGTE